MSSLRSRYPHAARRGAGYPTRARPGLIKVPVEKYRVVLLYVALLYPYSTVLMERNGIKLEFYSLEFYWLNSFNSRKILRT